MKRFKNLVEELLPEGKAKKEDWHIRAERVRNVSGILTKHKEIYHHGKDPTFDSFHHFMVHGTEKQAEGVRRTIWDHHNNGAEVTLNRYHGEDEDH